jgi:hypothetical protein
MRPARLPGDSFRWVEGTRRNQWSVLTWDDHYKEWRVYSSHTSHAVADRTAAQCRLRFDEWWFRWPVLIWEKGTPEPGAPERRTDLK